MIWVKIFNLVRREVGRGQFPLYISKFPSAKFDERERTDGSLNITLMVLIGTEQTSFINHVHISSLNYAYKQQTATQTKLNNTFAYCLCYVYFLYIILPFVTAYLFPLSTDWSIGSLGDKDQWCITRNIFWFSNSFHMVDFTRETDNKTSNIFISLISILKKRKISIYRRQTTMLEWPTSKSSESAFNFILEEIQYYILYQSVAAG